MACAKRYKTSDPFRGLLVIINNVNFDASGGHLKRDGSEKDVDRLRKTFDQLGFEIKLLEDRTCGQMLTDMSEVAHLNLEKYDCLAVVILTHGEEGNIICGVGPIVRDRKDECPIDRVLQPLKEIKREIPKLVFVQACRGYEMDRGHIVQADGSVGSSDRMEKDCLRLPIEADFFYHYSSSPGFFSFRNSVKGSVFIQELCNVYDECIAQGDEFNVLLSHVEINSRVAENFESYKPENRALHGMKQMPSFVTMLRKNLFLKKRP